MVNLWDRNQVLSCFSVSTELGMWLAQRATYFLLFPYFIFCSTESSLLCVGFSLQWLLPLQSTGSRPTGFISCSTCGPGLSSSGTQDLPGPGLEHLSPVWAGRLLSQGGKSPHCFLIVTLWADSYRMTNRLGLFSSPVHVLFSSTLFLLFFPLPSRFSLSYHPPFRA